MRKNRDHKVKYIGESARSGYERGGEHVDALNRMDERSHLLKHYVVKHRDIELKDFKFGMKIRSVFRTSIKRQVGEAVLIHLEKDKGTLLMNSKSEYNRCTLPRISTMNHKECLQEEG